MTGRLEGKVALISGAARGMGAAEARLFVAEGAAVVIGDILDDEAAVLAKELGERAWATTLDVTSEESWRAAVAGTVERFGGLDVLVNNAGIAPMCPLALLEVEEFRRVIDVNQIGVFLGMKSAIPTMVGAKRGSIVNISSIDGIIGNPGMGAYVSTKFAVRGMTKVAAIELGPFGVRVNSIHPGGIETPMLHEAEKYGIDPAKEISKHTSLGRIGRAEEVAELALFLASDASSYCTGSEFIIDGGTTAGFGFDANATG